MGFGALGCDRVLNMVPGAGLNLRAVIMVCGDCFCRCCCCRILIVSNGNTHRCRGRAPPWKASEGHIAHRFGLTSSGSSSVQGVLPLEGLHDKTHNCMPAIPKLHHNGTGETKNKAHASKHPTSTSSFSSRPLSILITCFYRVALLWPVSIFASRHFPQFS